MASFQFENVELTQLIPTPVLLQAFNCDGRTLRKALRRHGIPLLVLSPRKSGVDAKDYPRLIDSMKKGSQ